MEASWADCPPCVLTCVLERLPAGDLAACASVCTSWRTVADQEGLWVVLRQRDFPQADEATLAVLLERARGCTCGSSSGSSGGRPPQRSATHKLAYWRLAREWACERCQQPFTDGANSPSACCYHTGILFSGGLMNGEALRYTCCNRRAHQIANGVRDSNGCTSAFHAAKAGSAWQRHGMGVKPRELPPEPVGPTCSSGSGGSSSGRASSKPWAASPAGSGGAGRLRGSPAGSLPGSPARLSPDPQEWHPNQRPGMLELPSRLFSGGSGAA